MPDLFKENNKSLDEGPADVSAWQKYKVEGLEEEDRSLKRNLKFETVKEHTAIKLACARSMKLPPPSLLDRDKTSVATSRVILVVV